MPPTLSRATETTTSRDLSPATPFWIPATTLSDSFSRDTKAITGSNNVKWIIQRSTSRRLTGPNSVDTLVGSKGFSSGVHYWEWKVLNPGSFVFGLLNSVDGSELRGDSLRGYLGNPASPVDVMRGAVGLSTVTHDMARTMGYELSPKIYHWYEAVDTEEVRDAWEVMSEGEWGSLSSLSLKRMIGDSYVYKMEDCRSDYHNASCKHLFAHGDDNCMITPIRYSSNENYYHWFLCRDYCNIPSNHTISGDVVNKLVNSEYSAYEGAAGYTFGILLDFTCGEAVMYIYPPSSNETTTEIEPMRILSLGTLFQDGRKYFPAVTVFGSNGRLELNTEAPLPSTVSESHRRYRSMMEANARLESEVRDLRSRLERLAHGLGQRATSSSSSSSL